MKISEMVEKAVEYSRLVETVSAENRRLLFAQIAQAYAQTAQAMVAAERWQTEQAAAEERAKSEEDLDALKATLVMFRSQERNDRS